MVMIVQVMACVPRLYLITPHKFNTVWVTPGCTGVTIDGEQLAVVR